MTATGTPPGVAAVVLAVVLLVGVAAGRAKRRWSLLLAGLVAVAVLGAATIAVTGAPGDGDPAAEITALYSVVIPLVVAYGAGWLCGRASWLRRIVVLAVAVLLLAAFPYPEAGRFTAETLLGGVTAAPAIRTPGAH